MGSLSDLMYKSGPAVIHGNVMMSVLVMSSSVVQQMVGVVVCSKWEKTNKRRCVDEAQHQIRASMNEQPRSAFLRGRLDCKGGYDRWIRVVSAVFFPQHGAGRRGILIPIVQPDDIRGSGR